MARPHFISANGVASFGETEMYEKQFFEENKSFCISFVIVAAVCIFGAWVCHDIARNDPVYNNTDSNLDRVEKRLDDLGQRIDSLQERIAENQKAVERITVTVTAGRENAEAVAGGITEAERRLDNAIQASGRIQNQIADIEGQYK